MRLQGNLDPNIHLFLAQQLVPDMLPVNGGS